MHGRELTRAGNLNGWIASEKLDGWRAVWTGSELQTRQGNHYEAPPWFLAGLPQDTPMDCELVCLGQSTHDSVKSALAAGDWHRLRLAVFDVPEVGLPVEAAHSRLTALRLPDHAAVVQFSRVESYGTAIAMMNRIVAQGGEGIMLRKPRSVYTAGRVNHLLKLKHIPNATFAPG
jgi:DNA ligase-1